MVFTLLLYILTTCHIVHPTHPAYFRAFLIGAPFSARHQVLGIALAFGGCLADRVSGAFFRARAGTGSASDSETDSDPEPESPSVDSSRSNSDSTISVGGGGSLWVGAGGVGFEGARLSPIPVLDWSRWLNLGEGWLLSPLPLPCEKGRFL